jgi:hypothetical protein
MFMFFADDSKVPTSTRNRVGGFTGVGGIKVHSTAVRSLEEKIESICRDDFGFPLGEVFKWSPSKDHWMREHLTGDTRTKFFRSVLRACLTHEAQFIVSVVDQSKNHAVPNAQHHEADALYMTLERFNNSLRKNEWGMAFIAKPSGGNADEKKLLTALRELRRLGTSYVQFERLSVNPVIIPFAHSRVMQAADLVVSTTTTMVAGLDQYASQVFDEVKGGFVKNGWGQIGGVGLKIHPSHLVNLYHWVVGDTYYHKGRSTMPLPNQQHWFGQNPPRA